MCDLFVYNNVYMYVYNVYIYVLYIYVLVMCFYLLETSVIF